MTPKIKPVMAWMAADEFGRLALWSVRKQRAWCEEVKSNGTQVVRVRISVVPNARRKVKK